MERCLASLGRDELPLVRVCRSRTRRRPRPRYRVFCPIVFEQPMELSFAKTPRFATSVLLTWLFEDEDDDEYENDTPRMSGSVQTGYIVNSRSETSLTVFARA